MLTFENRRLNFPSGKLMDGTINFVFSNRQFRSDELTWTYRNTSCWHTRLSNGLSIELQLSADRLAMRFGNGDQALLLKEIVIEFPPQLDSEAFLEYTHSRWFYEQASGVKPVGIATPILTSNPPSHLLYLLAPRHQPGPSLLMATLPPNQGEFVVFQAVHPTPVMRGKFGVRITAEENRTLAPQTEFALSELLFQASEQDPTLQLEALGELYARHRTLPLKPPRRGWNSWDARHTDVKPEDVYRIEPELLKFSHGQIRTFVVDDGWQLAYGAWRPNPKFPCRLHDFCREVTERGGIPGIWTAPLCLANSYMVPSAWVVTSPNPDRHWVLDITHPEAQQYLRTLYTDLYQAGFRYFKVDFTNCILETEKLYDQSMGKAGVLRLLYRIIREAIGPDSYFLGCCVPYEPAFDLVDAVRTTADIQIYWSCVVINMISASARWWMHRRLWNNDPDFLVVRGPETSRENFSGTSPLIAGRYGSGPVLSRREAMTLALALYMTNGDLMLSDDFSQLNEAGRDILRRILELPPLSRAARPVDLFTCPCGEPPSQWWAEDSGQLAIFNWSEDFKTMTVKPQDFGRSQVSAMFWNEKTWESTLLPEVNFTLAPHEAIGVTLT